MSFANGRPWSLASLMLGVAGLIVGWSCLVLLVPVKTGSTITLRVHVETLSPLLTLAAVSLLTALTGAGAAVVAAFRREGPRSLAGLALSAVAAIPLIAAIPFVIRFMMI